MKQRLAKKIVKATAAGDDRYRKDQRRTALQVMRKAYRRHPTLRRLGRLTGAYLREITAGFRRWAAWFTERIAPAMQAFTDALVAFGEAMRASLERHGPFELEPVHPIRPVVPPLSFVGVSRVSVPPIYLLPAPDVIDVDDLDEE